MPHVQGTFRRRGRVLQQGHLLPDQRGVDFVEDRVQADCAILVHPALVAEAEELVEIQVRVGAAHVFRRQGPLVQRRAPVQAAVRALVVLAFQPRAPLGVERGQRTRVGLLQVRQELGPDGAEEAFDLALAGRLVGAGVDQMHAQAGAHHGQLPGAVVGTVVGIQTGEQAAPQHGLLEHRQEGRSRLGEGKGGVRHDTRGVVEQRGQVGLATAAVAQVAADGGAVQHVEVAFVVEAQPVAQGLLGHVPTAAAGDLVVATGLGPERRGPLGRARRQMQQFCKDAETEQGHFARQLGIRFGHGVVLHIPS